MVGGETAPAGAGAGGARVSEAAQALTAILQTQYLRYLIIATWALGLIATVGPVAGAVWFIGTTAAGMLRSAVERQVGARLGDGWGLVFPAVATGTTAAWATAPLLAWYSGHPFGQALAIALIMSGYVLVFSQLNRSPKQALLISSPYSLVACWILATSWGTSAFWPLVGVLPLISSSFFVLVTMSLLREARIAQFQDHQAHLIAELEAARDKANAANAAKSSFLGVISHELRTPMNGVLGAAQLMSATNLDTTQREYLSIIRNSGDSLLGLLNDILDMTKIEAGKMTFEVVDVDVSELARRGSAAFAAQAEAKGIRFVMETEGEVPQVVRGDPLRVGQVIQNLLSNAVKFTDEGEVRYTIRGERLSERRCRLAFEVRDTGSGIAPEDLERLFQPFTQVDASSTRRFGGTGLGLTIARRMAQIMSGDIEVTSRPGEGSTFIFTCEAEVVSWAETEPVAAITAEVGAGASLSVLVVEDHPVNRMILEAWMTSGGHVTASAENGELALDIARRQTFDLIVMDVNMPVMDGLTATRRIREEPGPNRETPIVVLSASARHEDHEAGLAAGADAYLNKPIDFQALAQLMAHAGEGREGVRESGPESRESAAA
jgi:signal transduction histidine kinase/ActR/RegA family two-component response regulator